MDQHLQLQYPPKFTRIWIFGNPGENPVAGSLVLSAVKDILLVNLTG
jgi:hypothetical protein